MRDNATFHGPFLEPAGQQNQRFGKRLGGEIYVASEASATLLQSYAPVSSFFGASAHFTALDSGNTDAIHALSSRATLVPGQFATSRIATKHLISGGFSS